MRDWAAANLALRAARDAMNEAKRRETAAALCPICGEPGCASPICEVVRRKAEQQARLAALAARDSYGVAL